MCKGRKNPRGLMDQFTYTVQYSTAGRSIFLKFNSVYVQVATWMDDTLSAVGHKLENPLQMYSEFRGHQVSQLHVCDLYSCVQLANSTIHWWQVVRAFAYIPYTLGWKAYTRLIILHLFYYIERPLSFSSSIIFRLAIQYERDFFCSRESETRTTYLAD